MRTRLLCQLAVIVVALQFSASVVWARPRFTDNGNGTVTDIFTELVWLKNASCLGNMNWNAAVEVPKSLASGTCGLSDGSQAGDWHLPSVDEFKSLICGPGAPAWQYNGCDGSNSYNSNGAYPYEWLTTQGFTAVQKDFYWTSSPYPDYTGYAWSVYMYYGLVDYYNGQAPKVYVWPVRVDNYVRVDGTPNVFYHSLQNAFDKVADDSVVRTRGVTFTENLSLNRVVDLKLFGGYSADYSSHDGVTTINGDLTIDKGSLVVDRVVIR